METGDSSPQAPRWLPERPGGPSLGVDYWVRWATRPRGSIGLGAENGIAFQVSVRLSLSVSLGLWWLREQCARIGHGHTGVVRAAHRVDAAAVRSK